MSKTALLSSIAALVVSAGIASAMPGTPATLMQLADSIPPNCTLDPFTHKMNCHIWPTCTMDPFTGKMNCPVPKAATRFSG